MVAIYALFALFATSSYALPLQAEVRDSIAVHRAIMARSNALSGAYPPRVMDTHRKRSCDAESGSSSQNDVKSTSDAEKSSSSSKSSSSKSTSSSSSSSSSSGKAKTPTSNAMALIWPSNVMAQISKAVSVWSTATIVSNSMKLSDAALNIVSGKQNKHTYGNAPDGQYALRADFTKGSISPGHSSGTPGFSLYSATKADMTKGNKVVFSYKAYFPEGFEFNKGGKMPGMYGGISEAVARQCSGGQHQDGACTSSRMMWRTGGKGELYAYFPDKGSNSKILEAIKPQTKANDVYGLSVARGSFTWATGAWTTVQQTIVLNDVGKSNGSFQVHINGASEPVIDAENLHFRDSENFLMRGAQIQTFFGGHDSSWASPKAQSVYFKDFSVAVMNV